VRPSATPAYERGDIGGYSLEYECLGAGSPTVVLDAGYAASGVDTYSPVILPAVARTTRACTYDRAGNGLSDPRPPSIARVTVGTQANELHALLHSVGVPPPYVLVGHSYGGMVGRAFAASYPHEAAGIVLVDASSEPEISVYDRLHAGPWIDGAPSAANQRIDIHASVRELERSASLGATPAIVITAGILGDRWLKTVPRLEARAQTRLAGLSSNSIHVLDRGIGHQIPEQDPAIVVRAIDAVVAAVRRSGALEPCARAFADVDSAVCLRRGQLGRQRVR
jgi:pimeloyl-ACP methyl ester carboxylesterase